MALSDTKPASQSVTIQASVVALVCAALKAFQVDIAPELVYDVIGGISAIVAIYGRYRATSKIA